MNTNNLKDTVTHLVRLFPLRRFRIVDGRIETTTRKFEWWVPVFDDRELAEIKDSTNLSSTLNLVIACHKAVLATV